MYYKIHLHEGSGVWLKEGDIQSIEMLETLDFKPTDSIKEGLDENGWYFVGAVVMYYKIDQKAHDGKVENTKERKVIEDFFRRQQILKGFIDAI